MTPWFECRQLRCRPASNDPRAWVYLPQAADVQRDINGEPLLTLIEHGAWGYLTFCATWAARPEDLMALRQWAAERIGDADNALIRISQAGVEKPLCRALIGDGHSNFESLSTSATSGLPPYDALFNLSLQGERLNSAIAALQGKSGYLGVEYTAQLPRWLAHATVDEIHVADPGPQPTTESESIRAFADIGAIVVTTSKQASTGGRHAAN